MFERIIALISRRPAETAIAITFVVIAVATPLGVNLPTTLYTPFGDLDFTEESVGAFIAAVVSILVTGYRARQEKKI